MQPYLEGVLEQFTALGMQVTVAEKSKSKKTNIDSAFLKADTTWKELVLKGIIPQEKTSMRPEIKIKLEVDTNPPPGFDTEEKLLLKPFSFYVKCFSLPDLFAGKVHALLFRKWQNRVKGRDWFDLEWYSQKGIPLHLEHLKTRVVQTGDWKRVVAITRSKDQCCVLCSYKRGYCKVYSGCKGVGYLVANLFS